MSGSRLNEEVRRLITQPGQEIGRLAAFVQFQARLWRTCAARVRQNDLLAMSAALSFRTIFAMIPALVLAFLAAGALGVLDDSKRGLRSLLEASGFAQIIAVQDANALASAPAQPAPADSKIINVADEIERVVTRVESQLTFERIGPIGAVLFIWTALSLLTTIEESLNRVFGAVRSRSVVRRVLVYWTAMTLGPVVLSAALFLGNRALAAVQALPAMTWALSAIGWFAPVIVGVLVLGAVYIFVPNTRVHRRAALGGALVAVMLWLLAKWGFALYVRNFVLPGNLYGILGVFPLFMMWVNLSWLIFLFGAELANTAASVRAAGRSGPTAPRPLLPTDGLEIAAAVARRFEAGDGPVAATRLAEHANVEPAALDWLLRRLCAGGVLCAVDGEAEPRYTLARSAERIPIAELVALGSPADEPAAAAAPFGAGASIGASPSIGDSAPLGAGPAALCEDIRRRLAASVNGLTLADVVRGQARDGGRPEAQRD